MRVAHREASRRMRASTPTFFNIRSCGSPRRWGATVSAATGSRTGGEAEEVQPADDAAGDRGLALSLPRRRLMNESSTSAEQCLVIARARPLSTRHRDAWKTRSLDAGARSPVWFLPYRPPRSTRWSAA